MRSWIKESKQEVKTCFCERIDSLQETDERQEKLLLHAAIPLFFACIMYKVSLNLIPIYTCTNIMYKYARIL